MHALTVDSVAALADVLPFDPSMIMGVTLAPETGRILTEQYRSSIIRDRYIDVISETISWRCKNEKIRRKKP